MSALPSGLQSLQTRHPEWNPWLSAVGEALNEAADRDWERFVPSASRSQPHAPVLARAAIALPVDFLSSWTRRLLRSAAANGTPAMATLDRVQASPAEAVQLFAAALCLNSEKLDAIAADYGADTNAFKGVAELLPIPFLQACGRRLPPRDTAHWVEGYCPLCGAWPAFAELRGIERARYLRCGRCGDEWRIHWLQCPFCGMSDHQQLLSLVPENGDAARAVDACKRCTGYLKSLTTLQGAGRLDVMIKDLASVDLDIAAVERGYRRPAGPGYRLNVTVGYNQDVTRRLFPRNR